VFLYDTKFNHKCFDEPACVRIHYIAFAARASPPAHYMPESFLSVESRLSTGKRVFSALLHSVGVGCDYAFFSQLSGDKKFLGPSLHLLIRLV
jgi:hypothetical protein